MKETLSLITISLCFIFGHAQDFAQLKQNLDWQVYNYPQEKIHVMTDKPYYITGDTVWLRAFVVNAVNHQPVDASKFVYVELLSPMNEVAMRIKIRERDGVFKGYLPLDPTRVAEGEYTLAAYTMFMQNQGEQYFFKKKVKITSSFAIKRKIEHEFEWKNQGKDNESLKINLRYLDAETEQPCPYNSFSYTLPNGKTTDWKGSDRNLSIEIDHKSLRDGAVFVQYGNYGKYITFPPSSRTTYDVSFYPEGGYLVPGFENRMTFKAINSNGKSIDITGNIVDGSGNTVASITTTHDGMGLAKFTPQDGISYQAICQNDDLGEKSFDLPQVRNDATVLQVSNEDKTVKIEAKGSQQSTAMIAVQQRGSLLATGFGSVTIETDTLPAGVVQSLLMNENGRMLSERLFFVTGKQVPKAQLNSDQSSYDSRELVQASVDLSDFTFADTIAGNFAVSVTDDRTIVPDTTTSILTELLLQSDLQGRINNPAWYFITPGRQQELDMLMMTQGWRRYDVPRAFAGKIVEPKFPIEQGQALSGTIRTEWRNKLMENATIKVIAPDIRYAETTTSDENGKWFIGNMSFPEGVKFVVQAESPKGSTLSNLKIDDDKFPFVTGVPFAKKLLNQDIIDEQEISYISNEKNRLTYIDGVANVLLDEVIVSKKKIKNPENVYETLSVRSYDYQFFEKRGVDSYETAIRYFAGIVRSKKGLYSIRDRNELVGILVDGVPLETYSGQSAAGSVAGTINSSKMNRNARKISSRFPTTSIVMESSIDDTFNYLIHMYPFDIVKQIDFIPGYAAIAIGGGQYKGGVLCITTKDGSEKVSRKSDITLKVISPLGFQRPTEFYAPRYDAGNGGIGEGTDLRETLYWNPNVAIGSNKQARFNFYTNDAASTSYTITIEGVTANGELIHATKKITKK
ncbi:MAG: hypothetical protein IJG81_08150 [Muribaculaceae bacterium]|nr:hypothetical protein [Muribaculaceae bacterium]